MTGDRLALFENLLGEAFEHFARAEPTVVWASLPAGNGDERAGRHEVSFPWPCHVVNSTGDLGPAVAERLAAGPVLLVPPWGRLAGQGVQHGRNEHEIALLDCVPAGPDSLLAVLMPASTLTSQQARLVREELAARWRPVLLLYASGVLPGIHPSFLVVAAFLCPWSAHPQPLRIFQVPVRPDSSAVAEDFRRLLKRSGGRGQFGYVLRDIPPPGDSLAFERHDPALAARKAELSVFGAAVTLDEIFELPASGMVLATPDLLCDASVPGAARIVTGRDLRRDGTIAPADEQTKWALIPPGQRLHAGDILMPQIFRSSDHGGLAVAEISDPDLPAVASNTVITLRPKRILQAPERLLILGFLRSPLARNLAAASTGGSVHLNRSALRELHLPQPDEALSTALDDLAKAVGLFETWRSEAEMLLGSVFTDTSSKDTRARIVSQGRIIRLRSDAAALLDDGSYIVRTRFPYPVAYRWREVEAAVSARSFKAAHEAILEAAEVLLCYAANLGLAVAHGTTLHLGVVKAIRARLLSGRSGLGFGDWTAVLEEIRDGRASRKASDVNPIAGLRSLLAQPDADAARQRLSDRRNDEAHLRRAGSVELPSAVDSSLADLTTLLQAANFLSDLPLIHVTAVHWDSLQKLATVNYRELMGDHPVVPTRSMAYDAPDVEVGSMYIIDGQRGLHLLRPFLTGRVCPKCRNWSTFHVDGAAHGMVTFKSLEHGHTVEDATLEDPLRRVGLLLFHCNGYRVSPRPQRRRAITHIRPRRSPDPASQARPTEQPDLGDVLALA